MTWRQIHDTVPASSSLAVLSSDAERLFWRLLSQSDAWGRLRGEPTKVLVNCVPLLGWSEEKVLSLLDELNQANRILAYEVDGREYVQLLDFDEHQPVTARRRGISLFPGPEQDALIEEIPANGHSRLLPTTPDNSRQLPTTPIKKKKKSREKGRVEKVKSSSPAIASHGAQELVAHLADEANRLNVTLPARTKGQSAKTIKELLADGMPEQTIRAALTQMLERGRPAAALLDIARQLETSKPEPEIDYPLLPRDEVPWP